MRRLFPILAALSISAWAQLAPAPAQPPIVVQVQMPPTPHTRDWIGYALPSLVILVSVSVGITQAYLQRQNQKQQLFDKRFKVYTTIREFISVAVMNSAIFAVGTLLDEFRRDTAPANFLFGRRVNSLIQQIDDTVRYEGEKQELIQSGRSAEQALDYPLLKPLLSLGMDL